MSDFFGKGWKFPVEIDRTGQVGVSSHEELIAQSIHVILGTAPGERVMRPDFGCAIHDLVFAPNNKTTASLAAHAALDALSKWEPRIDGIEVHAEADASQRNQLNLSISYRVRANNTTRNLVYPFYLRGD